MAANTRWGPIHCNNNVICAIDVRTGGPNSERADLLEICFLPVNHSFQVSKDFSLFHLKFRPVWPVDKKYAQINDDVLNQHKMSCFDAAKGYELFERWFVDTLGMKQHKKIMPLVWNYETVRPWLKAWMGDFGFEYHIHENYRDCMSLLNWWNDRHAYFGEEVPYKHPTFGQLVTRSGVKLVERNSVPSNCKALVECYHHMVKDYVPAQGMR